MEDNFKDNSIPKGVTDFLPKQSSLITRIENMLSTTFELWGFSKIIPPGIEFEEMVSLGMDDSLRERSIRFEDRHSHKLLTIPADITPQIARIEAMRMTGYPLPHRLYYNGRVLRHIQSQSGRSREIFQSGVELIGLDSPEADAEMIAMSAAILRQLGFESFKIDLGQVEFYRGIMDGLPLPQSVSREIEESVRRKDASTVTSLLENLNIPDSSKSEISALPRMFGGIDTIERAFAAVKNDRSKRALDNLFSVVKILDIHGVSDCLTIDLGEIRGLSYHSGLTFEGFVPFIGEPVCGGGRYDNLMGRYGRDLPATGFAFNILNLLQSLEKAGEIKELGRKSFLVFNERSDKRQALQLATALRSQGCAVTRDIIRRDLDQSMVYAERSAIDYLVTIPAEIAEGDVCSVIRVSDKSQAELPFEAFMASDFIAKIDTIF